MLLRVSGNPVQSEQFRTADSSFFGSRKAKGLATLALLLFSERAIGNQHAIPNPLDPIQNIWPDDSKQVEQSINGKAAGQRIQEHIEGSNGWAFDKVPGQGSREHTDGSNVWAFDKKPSPVIQDTKSFIEELPRLKPLPSGLETYDWIWLKLYDERLMNYTRMPIEYIKNSPLVIPTTATVVTGFGGYFARNVVINQVLGGGQAVLRSINAVLTATNFVRFRLFR